MATASLPGGRARQLPPLRLGDPTATIVEMAETGQPTDIVLFADPGSEKSGTYAFLPIFRAWMADHGIASEICRYQSRDFRHWPPYATIAKNMLTNVTLLPGVGPVAPEASRAAAGWAIEQAKAIAEAASIDRERMIPF